MIERDKLSINDDFIKNHYMELIKENRRLRERLKRLEAESRRYRCFNGKIYIELASVNIDDIPRILKKFYKVSL